jgi:hypothetical protein
VAAVEALEPSGGEDEKHKVVLRNGKVLHGLQFFNQYQQAMTEPNLIRAKGVCGFLLHEGPRKWENIPKSERLRAVAELVWEFKDDDWTWGYSHPIFEDMVRKTVRENNRQVNSLRLAARTPGSHRAGPVVKLEPSAVARTGLSHDQEGDLEGSRMETPIRTVKVEEHSEVHAEEPFPFTPGHLHIARYMCGLNVSEIKTWEEISPSEKYHALMLLSEGFEYTGWDSNVYEQLLKRLIEDCNDDLRDLHAPVSESSMVAIKPEVAIQPENVSNHELPQRARSS